MGHFSFVRRKRVYVGAILFVAILGAIVIRLRQGASHISPALDSPAISRIIAALPHRAGKHPAMRLKEGLVPPTNTWFSSLVFSTQPQPIFAYPLTYKPLANGFEASYPAVTGSADTLFQVHAPAITAAIGSATYRVTSYDDLSVDVQHIDTAGTPLLTTKVTHGSPFIFARADSRIPITINFREGAEQLSDNYYVATYAGKKHGIYSQAPMRREGNTLRFVLEQGQIFTTIAIPDSTDSRIFEKYAARPITSTSVRYQQADSSISTTFTLGTTDNSPTLFALMPHQQVEGEALGTYNTTYGELSLKSGATFTYELAAPRPPETLELSRIQDDKKNELRVQLRRDAAATSLTKIDTYFGGKELERAANLLELAHQLNMTTEKQRLMSQIRQTLDDWLEVQVDPIETSKYFFYDPVVKGIVGAEPSFGSEQFNDHHFHYGYFIYAASILARYDSSFLDEHKDMVSVLVADIASQEASAELPRLRAFDSYVGHSWASGYSDFADGNNQESASEAVNAWYATYLWARVNDNDSLALHSLWLYQHEAQAATRYWLGTPTQAPGFNAPFTSIIWGGKRDYATWFSPRPQAKLGIQLIPMSPGHGYLGASKEKVRKLLRSVAPSLQDLQGQFGDYLIMYEALADPTKAIEHVRTLKDSDIDTANSRTYLMAWLYTR